RKSIDGSSSRLDHHAGGPAQAARSLPLPLLRHQWRPDLLWARFDRSVSPSCRVYRPYPQGRQTGRSAGPGTNQVRVGDQPKDRQGARFDRAGYANRPRRRGDRVRRREFLCTSVAGLALRPFTVFAQTSAKRPLVACLVGGSKAATERYFGGFSQGMRELGYVESRDYGFEVRYAEGDHSRSPLLAEELVRLKPDVLVLGTTASTIAVRKLTDAIPIVSSALVDPVGFGWAASHARPGGNVTGMLLSVEDMPSKQLALAV